MQDLDVQPLTPPTLPQQGDHELPLFSLDHAFPSAEVATYTASLSQPADAADGSGNRRAQSPFSGVVAEPDVLFDANDMPIAFNPEALMNVDLNRAPPNWNTDQGSRVGRLDPTAGVNEAWNPLHSTFGLLDMAVTAASSGMVAAPQQYDSFFSSTGAADDAGKAERPLPDIVADADDLRQLLLAPFHKAALGFVLHRVGPSLVVEGVSSNRTSHAVRDSRNRALKSKFLYFSILAEQQMKGGPGFRPREQQMTPSMSSELQGGGEAAAGAAPNPGMARKALHWRFDDINVLLGVNTPTLVDPRTGERLSVAMKDSTKFLDRIETLDLWLQNVMTNVPGVAVCYHTDGVVQGCQVVNTEDIPDLSSQPFEPVAVQRHASRLLRWLKEKCTEDAASYVLLKDPVTGELKLYNLSALHRQQDDAASRFATKAAIPLPNKPDSPVTPISEGKKGKQQTSPTKAKPRPKTAPAGSPNGRSVVEIDEDADDWAAAGEDGGEPEFHRAASPTSSVGPGFVAFRYPLAMMCFRMSQALPSTDAETMRLLTKTVSMLDDADPTSLLPLVVAHSRLMQYHHASSPLSEAESIAVSHGRHAVECLQLLHAELRIQRQIAEEQKNEDPDGAAVQLLELETVELEAMDHCGSVVKAACAIARQLTNERSYGEAMEALHVAQAAVQLRRDVLPSGLLRDNTSPATSPPRCGSPEDNTASPEEEKRARIRAHHRLEAAAGVVAIETLVGDACHHLLEDLLKCISAKVEPSDGHDTVAKRLVADITTIQQRIQVATRIPILAKRLRALAKGGVPIDDYRPEEYAAMMSIATEARDPPDHLCVMQKLEDVVIPSEMVVAITSFRQATSAPSGSNRTVDGASAVSTLSEALQDTGLRAYARALEYASTIPGDSISRRGFFAEEETSGGKKRFAASTKELRRRLAGLYSMRGSIMIRDRLNVVSVDVAIAAFGRARDNFSDVRDGGNVQLMRINRAKAIAGKAELAFRGANVFPEEEERLLRDAIDELLPAVFAPTGDHNDSDATRLNLTWLQDNASDANAALGPMGGKKEISAAASATLANFLIVIATRTLSGLPADELTTAAQRQLLERIVTGPLSFLNILRHVAKKIEEKSPDTPLNPALLGKARQLECHALYLIGMDKNPLLELAAAGRKALGASSVGDDVYRQALSYLNLSGTSAVAIRLPPRSVSMSEADRLPLLGRVRGILRHHLLTHLDQGDPVRAVLTIVTLLDVEAAEHKSDPAASADVKKSVALAERTLTNAVQLLPWLGRIPEKLNVAGSIAVHALMRRVAQHVVDATMALLRAGGASSEHATALKDVMRKAVTVSTEVKPQPMAGTLVAILAAVEKMFVGKRHHQQR